MVNVQEEGEGGMSWLEIGSLFEQRAGRRMPRRRPQDKTLEEKLTERGAAIQDHIKAFVKAIKEAMRWAFHQDDAQMWKPKKRAKPRLAGMGITTTTAAVRL